MVYQGGAMRAMRTGRLLVSAAAPLPPRSAWIVKPGTSTTIRATNRGARGAWSPAVRSGRHRRPLGRAAPGALVLLLGGRPLGQAVDQRPDLAVRVPAVAAEGADEGQLALLGPAGDGLRRHLEQGRGLRRGQVLGFTRLGLAHLTPSYGHGPDRTCCRSWCLEPAAAKLLRIRVVRYSVRSAGACWTLMTTTSPSLRGHRVPSGSRGDLGAIAFPRAP